MNTRPELLPVSPRRSRAALVGRALPPLVALGLGAWGVATLDDPVARIAAALAAACLAVWLGEWVPPFVPGLALIAAIPLALERASPEFALARVLGWAADPVLVLFFGGFALGAAASAQGVDARVAASALRLARGRRERLALAVLVATAVLSMWISNIAAAALMIAALRPVLHVHAADPRLRTGLLLALAAGANFGGMATPVGTGPNAIALAALERTHPIGFAQWMAFGVPLAAGLALVAFLVLRARYGLDGPLGEAPAPPPSPPHERPRRARTLGVIFATTAMLWLAEPLHGIAPPAVALASVVALFVTGVLGPRDLGRIDWSTLLLIAGGLVLGRLLEQGGVVAELSARVPWTELPPFARRLALVLASAAIAAVSSNTAGAAMLVPLAASIDPSPATAILVAMGASLGVPFAISTPPNAMVHGHGVPSHALMSIGFPLMLLGAVVVAATGPLVLRALGIP